MTPCDAFTKWLESHQYEVFHSVLYLGVVVAAAFVGQGLRAMAGLPTQQQQKRLSPPTKTQELAERVQKNQNSFRSNVDYRSTCL